MRESAGGYSTSMLDLYATSPRLSVFQGRFFVQFAFSVHGKFEASAQHPHEDLFNLRCA